MNITDIFIIIHFIQNYRINEQILLNDIKKKGNIHSAEGTFEETTDTFIRVYRDDPNIKLFAKENFYE